MDLDSDTHRYSPSIPMAALVSIRYTYIGLVTGTCTFNVRIISRHSGKLENQSLAVQQLIREPGSMEIISCSVCHLHHPSYLMSVDEIGQAFPGLQQECLPCYNILMQIF